MKKALMTSKQYAAECMVSRPYILRALRVSVVSLFFALVAASAAAQTVTVTASNINVGGVLLPQGIISFCPAGAVASGFQIGSTGQTGGCVQRDVVTGVIQSTLNGTVVGPMLVADTSLSAPQNPCYNVLVADATGNPVIGTANGQRSGYGCVQPAENVSPWCTSGACDFDLYLPTIPEQPLGQSIAFLTVGDIDITGTCTGNCSGGGSLVDAGAQYEVQLYQDSAHLTFVPEVHLGAVLIDQGPGQKPAFADPLVQGTQAAGSTTEPNPVMGGVWDGTHLRASAGDSSGNADVNVVNTPSVTVSNFPSSFNIGNFPSGFNVNNFPSTQAVTGTFWQSVQPVSGTFWQATQPVSGTFWQSTQPVSIATMPTTPVTGTFWQATQPVSGTFWQSTQPISSLQLPAALDGSGFLKTHEQGTANVNVQNSSIAVTGTFWQTTQPVSGTVTTSPPANASSNVAQYGGTNVGQSNPMYVQPTDGTHNTPAGDSSARSIHVTPDSLPSIPAGSNNIGSVNQGTSPWVDNVSQLDGTALGAPSAYGTSPGAVNVPGVNANVTNTVATNVVGNGSLLSGQQAVTATAAALPSNSVKRVCVKAFGANTIPVYVGPSGVTSSTGLELNAYEATCLPVTNSNLIYVVASTTGASVSWIATN